MAVEIDLYNFLKRPHISLFDNKEENVFACSRTCWPLQVEEVSDFAWLG